jgi:ABC-type glycerol-3-phosphate transport system permease component
MCRWYVCYVWGNLFLWIHEIYWILYLAKLHRALYFSEIRKSCLQVQKYWKKSGILDVVNDVAQTCKISMQNYLCFGRQKWQNLTNSIVLKCAVFTILRSTLLSFCVAYNTNSFALKFGRLWYTSLSTSRIFPELSETLKYGFSIFENKGLPGA